MGTEQKEIFLNRQESQWEQLTTHFLPETVMKDFFIRIVHNFFANLLIILITQNVYKKKK